MTNPLREHLRLSAIEVKRIVWHKNFLLVVGVMFLLACYDLFWVKPYGHPAGFIGIVSTTYTNHAFEGIVAGVASASALAVDTQSGFIGLVLSRNVRRRDYLLHKAAAMFTVAVLASLMRKLWLVSMGAVVLPWPWDVPVLTGCLVEYLDKLGGHHCAVAAPNLLRDAPSPFPALFLAHPVLHDVILVLLTAFGTGVLALSGLLVAACGGNAYLAMAIPAVYPFAFSMVTFGLPDWTGWFDPTNLLGFWFPNGYFRMLPGLEHRLRIWFIYWWELAVLFIGLSLLIAEKRELALKEHGS